MSYRLCRAESEHSASVTPVLRLACTKSPKSQCEHYSKRVMPLPRLQSYNQVYILDIFCFFCFFQGQLTLLTKDTFDYIY